MVSGQGVQGQFLWTIKHGVKCVTIKWIVVGMGNFLKSSSNFLFFIFKDKITN